MIIITGNRYLVSPLGISKEVLRVLVGQKAAKLQVALAHHAPHAGDLGSILGQWDLPDSLTV